MDMDGYRWLSLVIHGYTMVIDGYHWLYTVKYKVIVGYHYDYTMVIHSYT